MFFYIIEEISKKGWVHIIYNDGSNCRVPLSSDYILDTITPIPLTLEILERNGFIGDKNVCKTKVRDDSKDELWQCEYAWYLKNLRIKNRTNGSVVRLYNIIFVHQLQHALRLCNIDKEIEL